MVAVSAIRKKLAESIGLIPNWHESRWVYDQLPVAEPDTSAHLAFAVGALSTTFDSAIESSRTRRGSAGGLVATTFGVRSLHRIRQDGQIGAYDEALDDEGAARVQILMTGHTEGWHLRALGTTRRMVASDWLLIEQTFQADHRIPIEATE